MSKEEVIFRITEGNMKGEEFVFDEKGLCLIGRSSDCALQIPKEKDMRISRRHCLLILDPPSVRIRDLGSRNGTLVNGELLQAGQILEDPHQMTPVDKILKDGDIVSIGESVLKIEIPSERPVEPVISQTKPHVKSAGPPTKVIKLTKPPTPMHTGTMIPKIGTGFFAPPSSNVSTMSSTIAKTEAIPRENMPQMHQAPASPQLPPQSFKRPGVPIGPGVVPSGPLAPPPRPKLQNDGGMTMIGKVAPGTLAPPPPVKPIERKSPPVLVGKIVSPKPPAEHEQTSPPPEEQIPGDTGMEAEQAPQEEPKKVIAKVDGGLTYDKTKVLPPKKRDAMSSEILSGTASEDGRPKVLQAKPVTPDSASGKQPKKLDSHMRTVVMSVDELSEVPPDILQQPPEQEDDGKPKKRVTKFKIKGPS
ncbi:MAG: FHA domain-containing protein [Victivallales bacterium]|nr:FHA domain-containing protein [Victivallales bacterium]